MNDLSKFDPSSNLAPVTGAMAFDMNVLEAVGKIADIMAGGSATIPKHLQGNRSDCFAIGLQSMQWGLNPFAVAQKTHITQSGALGYEAQLIAAVIIAKAPVTGRPEYEFIGDWSKVLGKVEEKRSDKGGKYYTAAYTKDDEQGLGCICRMTIIGEREPRELTVMLSQCYPRFSTQWATDPQQQITYAAIRKWSRRYTPDVILGVYTPEEQEERGPRDMGHVDEVSQPPAENRTAALRGKLANKRAAAAGADEPPSADAIIKAILAATNQQELATAIEHVLELPTDADKQRVRVAYTAKLSAEKERLQREAAAAAAKDAPPPATDPAPFSYAEVAHAITHAESLEVLDDAADLIGSIQDPQQRDELVAMFQARQIELDNPAQ